MDHEPVILRLPGLTPLDQIELEEVMAPGLIRFEDHTVDEKTLGEPLITTAIITLSAIALRGLIAWLLKDRLTKRVEKTVEVIRKDGTVTRTVIKVDLNSATAKADILKQLNLGEDYKQFLDLPK